MKKNLKDMYIEKLNESVKDANDFDKSMSYYEALASFYDSVKDDSQINTVFGKNNININIMNLMNILEHNPNLSFAVMPNQEVRFRIVDNENKASYVITDASNKEQGGSPHQNSHEHYYVSEICKVDQGSAIASTLLPDNRVKLNKYNSGEFWTSIPGVTHNTSLYDQTCTTTFKTPSPLQDWYGTGNVINSANSYLLDSYTKTLDLDEMEYIIKRHDGMIDDYIVKAFNLKKRWEELYKNYGISPYEVLIDDKNREYFHQLLLLTKSNDLGAFYANLTKSNIRDAIILAIIFGDDVSLALSEFQNNGDLDTEKAKKFAEEKKLIK